MPVTKEIATSAPTEKLSPKEIDNRALKLFTHIKNLTRQAEDFREASAMYFWGDIDNGRALTKDLHAVYFMRGDTHWGFKFDYNDKIQRLELDKWDPNKGQIMIRIGSRRKGIATHYEDAGVMITRTSREGISQHINSEEAFEIAYEVAKSFKETSPK